MPGMATIDGQLLSFESLADAVAQVYDLEGEDEGTLALAFVGRTQVDRELIDDLEAEVARLKDAAAAADHAQAVGFHRGGPAPAWSRELPTAEGRYWFQLGPSFKGQAIIEIRAFPDGLALYDEETRHPFLYLEHCKGGRWCGPIAGPDPAEPWAESSGA